MYQENGELFKNIFAAGEIMAGDIQGYIAGFGMSVGSVFGHLAGENALELVKWKKA
ncbi:hypothetical protein ABZN43_02790 [Campylobacter jejuni]|nr:hypothetical protein QMK15_02120 [Campylobacter jejuni]